MTRAAALLCALLGACSAGPGERCSAAAPCPPGLRCAVPVVDGGPAEQGVCDHPLRALGERCSQAGECEPALTCSSHYQPGSRYGNCVPRSGAGAPCFMDRDCQSGACQGASGTALDGVCR